MLYKYIIIYEGKQRKIHEITYIYMYMCDYIHIYIYMYIMFVYLFIRIFEKWILM